MDKATLEANLDNVKQAIADFTLENLKVQEYKGNFFYGLDGFPELSIGPLQGQVKIGFNRVTNAAAATARRATRLMTDIERADAETLAALKAKLAALEAAQK